jgi:hypothetical protein
MKLLYEKAARKMSVKLTSSVIRGDRGTMSLNDTRGSRGLKNWPKKCHVLFEWPPDQKFGFAKQQK